jgi:hypothetical protein
MHYKDKELLLQLSRTMTDNEIGNMFGCDASTIRYWRIKFFIPKSMYKVPYRKYTINHDFFANIDTAEKAYVLGFISADGYIHKNYISIAIQCRDEHILLDMRNFLGSNAPIGKKARTSGYSVGGILSVINFCSTKLVSDIVKIGVTPNKSLSLLYPIIPSNIESHYIRGLFDGDGHIGHRQFSLTGTDSIVSGVQESIFRNTGCALTKGICNHFPRLVGSRRSECALRWMYNGSTIHLHRKYETYKQYW